MNRRHGYWIAAWVVLVVVTGFLAFGHGRGGMGYYDGGAGPVWGHMGGWGHMGNWGEGYRGERGYRGEGYRGDAGPAWRGMGPDMMGRGGYGPGWGMTGMMGGAYGAPGMGYGMGMPGGLYGTMPWALPDLTPEQEQKLIQLHSEPQNRQRALMQQVWASQASLSRLYAAEKRDWPAIRTAALALHDVQRQHIEAAIDLQQKTDALLTDSQRRELARAQRGLGWMGAP